MSIFDDIKKKIDTFTSGLSSKKEITDTGINISKPSTSDIFTSTSDIFKGIKFKLPNQDTLTNWGIPKPSIRPKEIEKPPYQATFGDFVEVLAYPFKPRKEAIPVRRMFEKEPIMTKLPPIITGAAGMGFWFTEILPKVATQAVANFSSSQKSKTPFGIDKRRLGFEGEGNIVESTGVRMNKDFEKRMTESPDTPKFNIFMSSLIPVSDSFDAFVAGDVLTIGARK